MHEDEYRWDLMDIDADVFHSDFYADALARWEDQLFVADSIADGSLKSVGAGGILYFLTWYAIEHGFYRCSPRYAEPFKHFFYGDRFRLVAYHNGKPCSMVIPLQHLREHGYVLTPDTIEELIEHTDRERKNKNWLARGRTWERKRDIKNERARHPEWAEEDESITKTLAELRPWSEWGKRIYLDTETTGLSYRDEVLSIGITDDAGNVFYTYCKPRKAKKWPGAQRVNQISPARVDEYRSFPYLAKKYKLKDLFADREIIIYNASFDTMFLRQISADVLDHSVVKCCMKKFAAAYRQWDDYHGDYKWQTLGRAAYVCDHQWSERQHSALADAEACRTVWQWMEAHPEGVHYASDE